MQEIGFLLLKKLNMQSRQDPAIPLLREYPKQLKTDAQQLLVKSVPSSTLPSPRKGGITQVSVGVNRRQNVAWPHKRRVFLPAKERRGGASHGKDGPR